MNKKTDLYGIWWFWVLLVVFGIATYCFIVAMSYSLHPTRIEIYANDEMVATAENFVVTMRDQNFNECMEQCFSVENSGDCFYYCEWHYMTNETAMIESKIIEMEVEK